LYNITCHICTYYTVVGKLIIYMLQLSVKLLAIKKRQYLDNK